MDSAERRTRPLRSAMCFRNAGRRTKIIGAPKKAWFTTAVAATKRVQRGYPVRSVAFENITMPCNRDLCHDLLSIDQVSAACLERRHHRSLGRPRSNVKPDAVAAAEAYRRGQARSPDTRSLCEFVLSFLLLLNSRQRASVSVAPPGVLYKLAVIPRERAEPVVVVVPSIKLRRPLSRP